MPKMNVSVPHSLPQEEAANRLKGFLEKIRAKYQDQVSDLQEQWGDQTGSFSFKTMGFAVKGNVSVEPDKVQVDGDLPFAAMMFKGKIEETIRENLQRLLA
jgi:hypothetical protein